MHKEECKKLKCSKKNLTLVIVFLSLLATFSVIFSFDAPQTYTAVTDESRNSEPKPLTYEVAVDCSNHSAPDSETALLNGVVLILVENVIRSSFYKALDFLNMNFLTKYSYPVLFFHEGLSDNTKSKIRTKLPSAGQVIFEDVGHFWRTLPDGVSEEQLQRWMNEPSQRKYQKRGYRLMCRFWAGLAWQLPSMDSYEYYWRLDMDSFLTKPLQCDPFRLLQENECDYGYRLLVTDHRDVVIDLWKHFNKWAEVLLLDEEIRALKRFALNNSRREYKGAMYFNNFEIGTMRIKRHPLYTSMFRYLDEEGPRGIMRYRWGDAPIHTLGVETVMLREGWKKCRFHPTFAGYIHGKKIRFWGSPI